MILQLKLFIYLYGWGLHLSQYNRKMMKKPRPDGLVVQYQLFNKYGSANTKKTYSTNTTT